MYWGAGLNAQQIISLINESDFSTKLENIKIENDDDLYKYISYICKELYKISIKRLSRNALYDRLNRIKNLFYPY